MTRWVLALVLVCTAWLTSCGSDDGGDEGDADPTPSPSASATADYFVQSDSDAINEPALEVHRLTQRATAEKQLATCNRVGENQGYAEWRRCWHKLLDPLIAEYRESGMVIDGLVNADRPEACQEELADFADLSRDLADELTELADDIDSNRRRDQTSAMDRYVKVVNGAYADYSEPFVPMTNACYSPEDLATITATPTDEASPAEE